MFQLGYEPHNGGESRGTPSCLLQEELDPVEARQYFLKFSLQRDEGSLTKLMKDLVDLVGIEPTTSSMPWKRAPSCATGPHLRKVLQ